MSKKSSAPAARETASTKAPAQRVVRDIRRRSRKHHSTEEKIRIVLEGLRGEDSIAVLCRHDAMLSSGRHRRSADRRRHADQHCD